MTQDLHERLDDLVADVPLYVVPDPRAAWAAGARRRARQRVVVGAVAAVVLALVASVVTWLPHTLEPQPADPDGAGVDGYPAHVVNPWVIRDLPMAPGPMAMVFEQSDGSWWVADAQGQSWRVTQHDLRDDFPPSLSPDGRWLGYLGSENTYMVRDLVTGDADGGYSLEDQSTAPWNLASQAPAFWSPSGRRLLLRAGGTADAVVLEPASTFTAEIQHEGYPAGWLDESTTAWVVPPKTGDRVRLVGVDLRGRTVSDTALDVGRRPSRWLRQWSASISPDGRRVAVMDGAGLVRVLRTSDGRRVRWGDTTAGTSPCSMSWSHGGPVVSDGGSLETLRSAEVTGFSVGDETVCAMAAADALDGKRYPGLSWWEQFQDWAPSHTWALAVWAALAVGLVTLLVVRRRRKALATTS